LLALIGCFAVAAPLLGDPTRIDLQHALTPSGLPLPVLSPSHLLGTDSLGRDILARLANGARVSLTVALVANVMSIALGALVGIAAGYYGKATEAVLLRFADIGLALPATLFALVLASLLPSGVMRVIVIITVLFWAYPARLVYGEVLRLRQRPFVDAAVAAGVPGRTIMRRHVLPHLTPMLLSYAPLNAAAAVGFEATLSFLGAGINPPTPSWGNMISEGEGAITYAPHLLVAPALMIMLTILSFLLIGEGLKRLNPELARVSWLGA
jgi:peptide/nickel transport system permease protein